MDFELTEGQKEAMAMLEALMKAPPPMRAVLTGYAGTGKTTLIKTIASKYGHPIILAPTGKAALRVQEATGVTAITIHRWIYHATENDKTGNFEFKRKPIELITRPMNGLVIVDEASMVGRDIWEAVWDVCQLLNLKILLVGDTFQLAPVEAVKEGSEPFAVLKDVNTVFRVGLTEVTRQALGNPVLRASMLLREQPLAHKALALLPRIFAKDFDDKCMETYQAGGAILVHKNDTRHRINAMIRDRLGYGKEIEPGEPLLVLRNNYDVERYNGEVVKYDGWEAVPQRAVVVEDKFKHLSLPLSFGIAMVEGNAMMLCREQVRGEAAIMTENVIGRASGREYLDTFGDERPEVFSESGKLLPLPHLHANFGYALTCHKSQGSEWGQVLVMIEPSTRYNSYEGRRWLYTAITRAREKAQYCIGAQP